MEKSENKIIIQDISQEIRRLLSFSVNETKLLQKNETLTPSGLAKTQR